MTDITSSAIAPEQPIARKSRRERRKEWLIDGWGRFRRNRLSVAGLVLVVLFLFVGLAVEYIAPYGPFALGGPRLSGPSPTHLFGTDHLGRDVFSGVVAGTRTSLQVGFLSTALSLVIGVVIGAISGFYGGRIDDLLMRFTEMFQVLPRFFLALVIVALFGANLWGTIFVISILSWPEIARLLRSEFLTLRERPFVMAAETYGAGNMRIMFREMLPNALTAVVVATSLQVPSAIVLEASLSFIGAGDPNVMSWGRMLNSAQPYLRDAWWTGTFPGIAISLMALSLALLADGINDFLNPRLRQKG